MHAEHAIGGFLQWNISRACRVMAVVIWLFRRTLEYKVNQTNSNPYQSPESESTSFSMRSKLKPFSPFTLSLLFFLFHSVAMVWFAATNVPIKSPNADSGVMVWIIWGWVDFPLGFPGIFVAETASTNVGAIAWLLVIGGFQWAFWGWLLQKTISAIFRSKRQ